MHKLSKLGQFFMARRNKKITPTKIKTQQMQQQMQQKEHMIQGYQHEIMQQSQMLKQFKPEKGLFKTQEQIQELEKQKKALQNLMIQQTEKQEQQQINTKSIINKITSLETKKVLSKQKIFNSNELAELIKENDIKLDKVKPKDVGTIKGIPKLEIDIKNPKFYPIPENYKLFLFYKPKGFICDKKDPKKLGRPSIFDFIKANYPKMPDLYCCVFQIGKIGLQCQWIDSPNQQS